MTPDQVIADRQGIGAARPRRRGLSDRPEVELHAAPVPGAEVPGVQLGRGRAGHLQGPRHAAVQPAHRDRGHDHRGLRDGHQRGLQLHPRRNLRRPTNASKRRWKRRGRPAISATTSWARASASSCTPATASAPTSAAKKPRCSNRWKARRASRASSRRSRRASACTASRPPSTTPRPSRRCPGSSATAARPTSSAASRTTAAPRSTRCPATSNCPATTKCRWARRSPSCWNWPAACARAASSRR